MTTNTKKKKSAREKRVLVASLIVAAVMVGGSTFAWFTSKDEVTNRLSASADYGVSITEDFTPPEDWVPGQNIKKEVSAVNTGNVDAFVRMWLTGEMKLVSDGDGVATTAVTNLTDVTTAPYTTLHLTKKDSSGNYFRVLSNENGSNYDRRTYQTGELVYADGAYTYTPNQVQTEGTAVAEVTGTPYTNGAGAVKLVDSESFTPTAAGLYIFRRNYDLDTANTNTGNIKTDSIQYSGYYFDGTTYYALKTANDSTVPGGVADKGKNVYIKELAGKTSSDFTSAISNVKVYTAKDTAITSGMTWTYNASGDATASPFGTTNPYFTVQPTASNTFKINIELENIGDGTVADTWQPIGTAAATTFYYTDDVEAGETTNKLVKTVQLDKGATQNDFLAFDFDLNVNLESIQVTKDDSGNETVNSVTGDNWAASTDNTGATGAGTAAAELASVKWTAK